MEAERLAAAWPRPRVARASLYDGWSDENPGEDVRSSATTSGTTAIQGLRNAYAPRVLKHCATYLAWSNHEGAGRRIRFGAAAACGSWNRSTRWAKGCSVDEGQLCRRALDTMIHDFRPENRNDLRAVAPRVWESMRRRCARRRDGLLASRAKGSDGRRHESGASALAQGKHRCWLTSSCSAALARTALGLQAAALGRNRRAPRSGRIPSSSSRPWACRCARSTARPKMLGAYTLHPFGAKVDPDTTGRGRWRPISNSAVEYGPTSTASAKSWCGTPTCSSLLQESGSSPPTSRTADAFRARRYFNRRQAARRHRPASRISPRPPRGERLLAAILETS